MFPNLQLYSIIAVIVLGLLGGAYGVYKYQKKVISDLNTKIETIEVDAVALRLNISTLENNIKTVNSTLDGYTENATQQKANTKELRDSINRLDVIKAKPTLVALKIEKSYAKFHLEKACITNNKEACNALKNNAK